MQLVHERVQRQPILLRQAQGRDAHLAGKDEGWRSTSDRARLAVRRRMRKPVCASFSLISTHAWVLDITYKRKSSNPLA